jgi:hypothetical protein
MYLFSTKESWDVVKLESMLLKHMAFLLVEVHQTYFFLGGSRSEEAD